MLGQPFRFKGGHQRRLLTTTYYPMVQAGNGKVKGVHIQKAELAYGGPLPQHVEVHHADGTKSRTSALVICQDHTYHMLLHIRTRVVKAGGNPNTERLCRTCKAVKPIAEFVKSKRPCAVISQCKACFNEIRRKRWAAGLVKRYDRQH